MVIERDPFGERRFEVPARSSLSGRGPQDPRPPPHLVLGLVGPMHSYAIANRSY